MTTQKILVIDDESDVCSLIQATAEDMGLDCVTATTAAAFLEALTPQVTLILIDLMMPDTDGIEVLRLLGEQKCRAGIVVMSGIGMRVIETAKSLAVTHGLSIVGHLAKPFRIADLEDILTRRVIPVIARSSSATHKVAPAFQVSDVSRAIDERQFVLHYQPQIDIATGACIGAEALVRWQHPFQGLIFPDDFITLTEDLGLIDKLTWIVIERSFAVRSSLVDGSGRPLLLSLNLSVFSLRDLTFPNTLIRLAKENGVPLNGIILEITESGLIRELSQTLDVLSRLRMNGLRLSIDDFGTGYSMMQQLRNIPANEIKIDKSLIWNMNAANDRVMVEKIIEMGHDLEMTVVAEGVETAEQLAFLRSKRCDVAQGYFFSKPLPLEGFLDWLANYEATLQPQPALPPH